ncbi:MAG: hypothetical protein WCG28_04010 [bacterium]
MPDDQNTTQNPISEENSIPTSPQEPTVDAPILPMDSEPANAPSDALESSPNDFSVKSNDIPPSNSTLTEAQNEPKTEEKQAENEPTHEPVSEPVEAPEPETAQIPVNEPLASELKISLACELLIKARNAIQFRKRKKLDKIMSLFLQQSKITNDEVEKFLHVSDATATRYLSILEKEGKIKQSGKTGKSVSYSRI